jgi:ATP-dependent Clp protease, protease subunit
LLTDHRAVLIRGPIDGKVAEGVIARLLFLQHQDAAAPVWLYLDSPGGSVTASLAIRDTLDDLTTPVYTHCLECAGGTAAILLAHGKKGYRSAARDAEIVLCPLVLPAMMHARPEQLRIQTIVTAMLAEDTGQATDTIVRDCQEERSFVAEDARQYGLIDRIED